MPFINTPETISGKVRVRTPLQADSLSSRYVFLNINNAEPSLGVPKSLGSASPDPAGIRYALLSNNSYSSTLCAVSAWRVWAYDNPTIATFSEQKSIALGLNAQPIKDYSLVYSNHPWGTNRYNSESLEQHTYNVYSLSGIYLFDSTTVGDPASATSFIVTNDGLVGINTDTPTERLTIIGNISAQGSLSATNSLFVANNSYLGNAKGDFTTVRGTLRVGDNNGIEFGNNNTAYNVNLFYGGSNILRTDDLFVCNSLSAIDNVTTESVTSRHINIIHTPANDGVNPVLSIGETDTAGFSGFRVAYDESINSLQLLTDFGGVSLTACSIDKDANVTGPMFPLYIPLSAFNMGTNANSVNTVNYAQSGVIAASELANRFLPGKGTIEMRFHLSTQFPGTANNKKLRFEMSPDNATWTNIVDTSDSNFSSLNTYRTGIMNFGSSPNIMVFQSATTTLPDGARNPLLGSYAYTPGTAIYWRLGIGLAAGLTETMALCAGYIRVSPY